MASVYLAARQFIPKTDCKVRRGHDDRIFTQRSADSDIEPMGWCPGVDAAVLLGGPSSTCTLEVGGPPSPSRPSERAAHVRTRPYGDVTTGRPGAGQKLLLYMSAGRRLRKQRLPATAPGVRTRRPTDSSWTTRPATQVTCYTKRPLRAISLPLCWLTAPATHSAYTFLRNLFKQRRITNCMCISFTLSCYGIQRPQTLLRRSFPRCPWVHESRH